MHVLVVEDHPQFRAALVEELTQRGHAVTTADSVTSAEAAWRQAPFPLVILDRTLSGADGLDLCRRIRQDEYGRSSVIVIMTGSIDPADVDNFIAAGADDYISKLLPWDQIAVRFAFAERRAMSVVERWATQQALEETDARFRSFMDHAPAIAWIKDEHGRFLYCNVTFAETFGSASGDIIGARDIDLWPDAADDLQANDRRVLSSGAAIQVIEELPHQDGTLHQWLATKFPLVDTAGAPCVGGMAIDVTDRARAEQELAAERELLQTIMDHVPDFLYVKDRASRFLRLNKATASFLGLTDPAHGIGKTDLDFFPEQLALAYYLDEQTVMDSGVPQINRLEPQNVDETLWYLTSTVPIVPPDGGATGLVGIARDVTDRRQMEELIRRSDERQRALLAAIPDLIVRFDRAGVQLDLKVDQGQAPDRTAADMIGKPLDALLGPEQAAIALEAAQKALASRTLHVVELRVGDGLGLRRFEARIVPSGDDELLMIGRDVTEQRLLEERLMFQATHDALTQLPNRTLFAQRLTQALAVTPVNSRQVAVLFIDLDGFKSINDRFGHAAGDQLLGVIGTRMRSFAVGPVSVARLGGDEFAVLIDNVERSSAPDALAQSLQDHLTQPVWIAGHTIQPSVSIGIGIGESGQVTPDALMREADLAMYQSKPAMRRHRAIGELPPPAAQANLDQRVLDRS